MIKILLLIALVFIARGLNLPSEKAANCSQQIAWFMQNLTDLNASFIASNEFILSGHFFNNLGSYDECVENPNSSYSLLEVTLPPQLFLFTGLCTVAECKASDFQEVIF